jgi:hypothetical protein
MGLLSKMMGSSLVDEKVYSPVNDTDIRKHLNESEIWKTAFKMEELTKEVLNKYPNMMEYSVKFDGLKPVQLTGVKPYNGK